MSDGFPGLQDDLHQPQGKRQEAASWFVEFKDHNQSVRRLTGFTSKAASEEMGRGLVKLVEFHVASGGQIDPALSRWLTTLPQRVREKLVAIGLLAAERVAVSKHLMEHLADFGKALYAKGSSPFHVEVVTARARRIIDACKFRFFADISASKVMSYLHELRADKDDKRGISAQTFNFYLQAVKQFCKWMVKDRRVIESPVAYLNGLNVKTDRRRDRRAFQVDELRRLLETARDGPGRHGTTGYERSLRRDRLRGL